LTLCEQGLKVVNRLLEGTFCPLSTVTVFSIQEDQQMATMDHIHE
jgi:hypothetical protein